MTPQFDYFIIIAAMRTGSNLLEANLNAIEGITSHGEAFNPHFIGRLKSEELLGVTLEERDSDPSTLLQAIRQAPGELNGFRFFQGHDQRVLEPVLNDPRCAKIILTRNPVDSYISLKIARETKQWQLKNIKRRREAQVEFDAEAFVKYLNRQQEFQLSLTHHLQKSGQVPFHIAYDDLNQIDILNGLAAWLGVSGRLSAIDDTLKPQNPDPALAKVTNPDEMEQALSQIDSFNLHTAPNFEPRRRPIVANYIATPRTPLMFMPMRGGTEGPVSNWMAALDAVGVDELLTNQNRKQTRHWLQTHPGHRKFTVLQHPLARAHHAFCRHILNTGPGAYLKIRHFLRNRLKIPIPGQLRDGNYPVEQHYEAFSAFLTFLRQNLALQTSVRVDGSWCSQSRALEGFAGFAHPDLILREDEIITALPDLARRMGHTNPPKPESAAPDTPFILTDIYDDKLEALAAEAYQQDYVQFGFDAWKPLRGAE
ncbi:nodulation protein NodH [Ruegeria sp. R14_0]|uniref:nodulation protein NodH n=1 Tax=Ruegeria sp. R14_0 TaxID=2821100 RepID=UPI001ADB4D4D|nr:nodulation protein NodH [Ruegeria sp. R14_0]MBO9446032.1 nodulation protein NodH [Ruegeria sp. R14_0]